MTRMICNFSCGAASAVATKLTISEYPADKVLIINAFVKEEHADDISRGGKCLMILNT
jgi:hypothetical protein